MSKIIVKTKYGDFPLINYWYGITLLKKPKIGLAKVRVPNVGICAFSYLDILNWDELPNQIIPN